MIIEKSDTMCSYPDICDILYKLNNYILDDNIQITFLCLGTKKLMKPPRFRNSLIGLSSQVAFVWIFFRVYVQISVDFCFIKDNLRLSMMSSPNSYKKYLKLELRKRWSHHIPFEIKYSEYNKYIIIWNKPQSVIYVKY